jgi:hypothetical protein
VRVRVRVDHAAQAVAGHVAAKTPQSGDVSAQPSEMPGDPDFQ